MASIRNIIETTFSTKGAAAAAAATQGVTKQQTRLGQTSASAGRQFSAQASGLGGLVSVYAGAAANIFAITSAFQALNKAARAEQTIAGTRALASVIGESGSSIIKDIQKITNGQLSLVEASQSANAALSAGFDSSQINRLAGVAVKASRALGRDLTDALQRVIRGTAKLEPELLDELGIFTRIEPAVAKYASQLGLASSGSLTDFQRRQAFVNAAIEEGERKFGIIQVSADTAQASFEKLSATFSDLITKVGGAVADILAPALDFISKNSGTAFLALAAVGSIVFRNLTQSIGAFAGRAVENLGAVADRGKIAAGSIAKVAEATERAQTAAQGFKGGFVGLGAAGGAEARDARDRAQQGGLTTRQMLKDQATMKKVAAAERAYRREIRQGNVALKDKEKALKASISRQLAAGAVSTQYGVAIKGAGVANVFFARTANVAAAAATALGTVLSVVGAAISALFIGIAAIQIIGTIFDADLIGGIIKAWDKLWESSRNLKAGIEGIAAAATNANIKELKIEGFDVEAIKAVNEQVKKLLSNREREFERGARAAASQIKRFEKIVSDPSRGTERGQMTGVISGQGAGGVARLGDIKNIEKLKGSFEALGIATVEAGGNSFAYINNLKKGVEGLNQVRALSLIKDFEELSKKAKTPEVVKDLKAIEIALRQIADALPPGLVGKVAKSLELPADRVAIAFKALGITIKESGVALGGITIADDFNKLPIQTGAVVESFTRAADLGKQVGDSLASGAAKTESLGAQMAALSKKTDEAKIALEALKKARGEDNEVVGAATAAYQKLEEDIKSSTAAYNALKNAELAVKLVEKEFSNERDAFQKAFIKGIISANGVLAKSEDQVTANRLANLQNIVDTGKKATKALETAQPGNKMISAYKKQAEAGRKATEAAVGAVFKLVQEIEKVNVELDKRNKKLTEELAVLKEQNKLAAYRRKTAEIQAKAQRTATMDQATIKNIKEVELRQLQDEIAGGQTLLQIGKDRIDGETAIAEAMEKQAKAASDLKIAQVARANQAAMAPLRRQEAVQRDLPNLFSDQQKNDLQKAIAIQEFNNGMRLIAERKAGAEREAAAQKAAIDRRERLLNLELATKEAEMITQKEIVTKQKEIADLNNKIELDKAKLNLELANRRKGELELEQKLATQRIESQKNNRLAELDIIRKRIEIIKLETDAFKAITSANVEWVNKFIEGVNALGGNVEKLKVEDVTAAFKTVTDETARAEKSLVAAEKLIGDIATEQKNNSDEEFASKIKQAQADATQAQTIVDQITKRQRIEGELAAAAATRQELLSKSEKELLEDKITALGIEKSTIDDNLKATKTKLETEAEGLRNNLQLRLEALQRERDAIAQLLNTISGIINDRLNKGVDDLFEALKNGTLTMDNFKQGVKQLFKDILFDIGKSVFKKFVLEPIQNSVKSALGGLLNSLSGGVKNQISTIQNMINTGQSVVKDNIEESVKTLKDVGIQSVYVTNVAEFCACPDRGVGGTGLRPQGVLGQAGADRDILKESDANIFAEEDDFGGLLAETGDASKGLGTSLAGTTEAVAGTTGGFNLLNGKIPLLNMSITDVIGKIGDFGAGLVKSIGGLFSGISGIFGGGGAGGGGGLFGTIFSGISGIFGGGAAAATAPAASSLMGIGAAGGILVASGGLIRQMNSGGAVMRDSVPALLEPGEFVMRKSAVDKAGLPAMQAMNSGNSQKNNMPPVKVQVENTGQPKEAQADTKMDGEAMIIKIITKDLNSNGPIRRSIRQNAR